MGTCKEAEKKSVKLTFAKDDEKIEGNAAQLKTVIFNVETDDALVALEKAIVGFRAMTSGLTFKCKEVSICKAGWD